MRPVITRTLLALLLLAGCGSHTPSLKVHDAAAPVPVALPRPAATHPAARARPIPAPRASRTRRPAPKPQTVSGGRLYKITWYCDRGATASGEHTHLGVVATAIHIPFGTRVVIDGIGTFVVEDRIGWGSDFDVWIASCSEARDDAHGAKYRRVRVG